jgi:zinc transporter, ZIP family
VPPSILAGLWGLAAASSLLLGAALGYFLRIPEKIVAIVMGFGSGVLISALSFELMEEAYERGGVIPTAVGFGLGATVFTIANWLLSRRGAAKRKEAGNAQPSEEEVEGSGLAIAVGTLVDAVPESIVIGLSFLEGGAVGLVAFAAIFMANLPEGLSSAAGMKKAGRSPGYIFGLWGGIVVISGIAAFLGYALFQDFPIAVIAATSAVAAGAILAMLIDTMIPEAVKITRNFTGMVAVVGFLMAYLISKLSG